MTEKQVDLKSLAAQAETLEVSFNTLLLSTLGAEQHPSLSYAPYVRIGNRYYVFISELSDHTQHLIADSKCSIMFIKDESDSRNLFARERLIYSCQAEKIDRYSDFGAEVLGLMQEKLGETVGVLRQLGDFRLFQLSPTSGRYVVGFGKAYNINGQTRGFSHIGPDQLKPRLSKNT